MANLSNRQKLELEQIEEHHFITIKQLARNIDASEMTIRRDLYKLADQKLVRLVYGGVTKVVKNGLNGHRKYSLEDEKDRNIDKKLRIVRRAVEFLEPNDVVFLDTGTTIQNLAECIVDNNHYTFITSSFNTLEVITRLNKSTVITPGGVFSGKSLVFYDSESIKYYQRYRANKAFFCATGFELELGLTCSYIEDAPLKQAMLESCKFRILLLDSTKFGQVSTCMFANINDFSIVVSDSDIPSEYAEFIRNQDVELILV